MEQDVTRYACAVHRPACYIQ